MIMAEARDGSSIGIRKGNKRFDKRYDALFNLRASKGAFRYATPRTR